MNFSKDKTSNDFVDWHCMYVRPPVTKLLPAACLSLCQAGCSFKMNSSNSSAYLQADTVLVCVHCASNIYAVLACARAYKNQVNERERQR